MSTNAQNLLETLQASDLSLLPAGQEVHLTLKMLCEQCHEHGTVVTEEDLFEILSSKKNRRLLGMSNLQGTKKQASSASVLFRVFGKETEGGEATTEPSVEIPVSVQPQVPTNGVANGTGGPSTRTISVIEETEEIIEVGDQRREELTAILGLPNQKFCEALLDASDTDLEVLEHLQEERIQKIKGVIALKQSVDQQRKALQEAEDALRASILATS